MHAQLADKVDSPASRRRGRARDTDRRARDTHEARLLALLEQDLASCAPNLGVAVARGCGGLEVRVFGPAAALRLFFDAAEAHAAHVRPAVRAAIERYAASLNAVPRSSEEEEED